MQYDENAEKYGYEGEMTPMKCDELKAEQWLDYGGEPRDCYPRVDVDEAIAELKDFAENVALERDDNQTAIDELQAENAELKAANKLLKEHIANGDVSRITWIDEVIELKQKLHDAEMRADLAECAETERKIDYDKLKAENARLKDKRLDVKDFAHVLKAFKFYLCQLTHCAYDERTAQWIIDNWERDYDRVEADK